MSPYPPPQTDPLSYASPHCAKERAPGRRVVAQKMGRVWMLRYAVIYIVYLVVGQTLSVVFVHARLNKDILFLRSAYSPKIFARVQAIRNAGHHVSIVLGFLYLLWPLAILYYMNRPHVKDAFARGKTPDFAPTFGAR